MTQRSATAESRPPLVLASVLSAIVCMSVRELRIYACDHVSTDDALGKLQLSHLNRDLAHALWASAARSG